MTTDAPSTRKPRVYDNPPFERIALLLQGGGALGSYQAGVYQALDEARIMPDWIAGISIGAINAALIAGNAPENRVPALRKFWEGVTSSPLLAPPPAFWADLGVPQPKGDLAHSLINQVRAFGNLMAGAPTFFSPRPIPPFFSPPGSIEAQSFYDVSPLRLTLERLVDFDRINAGETRFSVGAVKVRNGNFVYFDNDTHEIGPEHIMASGALPPGFPAAKVDGEFYWDGGLVSNTPLDWVLDSRPRKDTLAFQVDLWSALGEFPRDLISQEVRQKDIRYSSRTRASTDQFKRMQRMRRALGRLLEHVPDADALKDDPALRELIDEADDKVFNIVHLIYHAKQYEGASKDYEFSRLTMEEHWATGYNDMVRTLRHPEALSRPTNPEGVKTFDVSRH
ncbi:hypothetical protein DLJ53_22330 [Acuticoccus sediminis]|uniref:PNPLA domain-containing protein n=1 Tax=Acuticoccus sediminis TaxID=2184697 RepID=A0A8B2NL57_9HYPH|nr:patatin-like phospholipase family protein [Acuticoccus sediminis]RAH99280.1 hypothetical protein DLJ53_22330 [Acuticoccus sediminis]